MNTEVIKSFLVGLGFGVDDTSLAKFQKSITSATLRVTALYGSVKLAAAGIVAGISEVSKGFEQMGYEYHIIAPAINKALLLRRELLKSYQLAGINIRKVVKDSINLNLSLTKTRFAFEAIYKSVASRFFQQLTKSSDAFRQKLYANMPKIQAALERFVKFIFKAVEITTILTERLYSIFMRVWDFLVMLDKATHGWSTAILAAAAAWKVLNLSFLASPLGLIIAGLVALLTLFDDFMAWKEGGKSLFDWSSFVPVIDAVTKALTGTWEALKGIGSLFTGGGIVAWLGKMLDLLLAIDNVQKRVGEWLWKLIGVDFGKLAPGGGLTAAPLGAGVSNSQTNQNLNQQTTVHIQGVPDAQAAGNAVSGVMQKNNFDLLRNMKGSVKAGGVPQ